MKSASNSHSVKSQVSSVHDNVPLYKQRIKEPGALWTKGFSLSFLPAMFPISSTLVLLEPHCCFWQTGVASLFVMLQRADFLAGARACSSWALPRPGLQKKHFSVFKVRFSSQGFSPSYARWHLPHHLWLWSKGMWVHSPAWGQLAQKFPCLCYWTLHPPENWLCAICPLERASGQAGKTGTDWELDWDRDCSAERDFGFWALALGLPTISFIMDTASGHSTDTANISGSWTSCHLLEC